MNERLRPSRIALAIGLGLTLSGCAATDATADRIEATALAARAAGLSARPQAAPQDPDPDPLRWQDGEPLTADLAACLALAENPELRAELEAISLARIDRAEAGLLPNPVVSLGVGAITDGVTGSPLSVRALLPLVWLWQRPDRVAAADADLRATILSAADRAARIVVEARRAHAAAVTADRVAAAARELVEVRARQHRQASRLFDAGLVGRADETRAALAAADAENALARDLAAAARARQGLLAAIGRAEADSGFPLIAEPIAAPGAAPDAATLVSLALERRLDVAAARAAVTGAAARTELADLARWPDLALGLGLERNFAGAHAFAVGGQVTPPLFDGGEVVVARAEAAERAAVLRALAVSQRAVRQTRTAHAALQSAREIHIRLLEAVVPAAERDALLARAAFERGALDESAWLAAEARRIERRIELHGQVYERQRAQLDLELAIGGALPGAAP